LKNGKERKNGKESKAKLQTNLIFCLFAKLANLANCGFVSRAQWVQGLAGGLQGLARGLFPLALTELVERTFPPSESLPP